MARISRAIALKMFSQGHPVKAVKPGSGASQWGFQSVASAPTWLTFEELERREREWLGFDIRVEWQSAPPGRKTKDVALGKVFRREPFKIGNLSGTPYFSPWEIWGDLPSDGVAAFLADYDSPGVAYAVWSYDTLIAWATDGGDVRVPSVRYSLTTTQHQHEVARALGTSFSGGADGSVRKGRGKSPYGPGWQTTKGV